MGDWNSHIFEGSEGGMWTGADCGVGRNSYHEVGLSSNLLWFSSQAMLSRWASGPGAHCRAWATGRVFRGYVLFGVYSE